MGLIVHIRIKKYRRVRRRGMDITVTHEMGRVPVTVLTIDGDIDSSNYEQLDQTAGKQIKAGAQYMLIDLTEVGFMSSAGFRSFTKIFKELRSISMDASEDDMRKGINSGVYKSPYLKLFKPSKLVAETLKIAGYDMLLEVHNDMKTAIASF
jgi:anti-anti-sigma factor